MIVFPKNRSVSIASGIVSIAAGFAALLWPTMTAKILAILVGVFLIAEALFSYLSREQITMYRWTAAGQGIIGLVIAFLLVVFPGITLEVVVALIAVIVIIRAVIQLWTAYRFRQAAGTTLYSGVFGALSLLVGILLFLRPEAGIIAFSWLIGFYAIISGVIVLLWSRGSGT